MKFEVITKSPGNLRPPKQGEKALTDLMLEISYIPHVEIHVGNFEVEDETVVISPKVYIDLTGSVSIGAFSMIGEGTKISTHDHYHEGRKPLLLLQEEKGVKWQDKKIGRDVWLHGCLVLYQVTEIPDGVVVGAGAVLTKNPEAYGIYAGNPAVKIGERI